MQKGVRERMFAALPAVQALEREDRETPVFEEIDFEVSITNESNEFANKSPIF